VAAYAPSAISARKINNRIAKAAARIFVGRQLGLATEMVCAILPNYERMVTRRLDSALIVLRSGRCEGHPRALSCAQQQRHCCADAGPPDLHGGVAAGVPECRMGSVHGQTQWEKSVGGSRSKTHER
jgi:hypothetical protein